MEARDGTESRFRAVLERLGGPQQVLLVGELWERAESRALLENFLRELFPVELLNGGDIFKAKEPPKHKPDCKGEQKPGPGRTGRFRLLFFLCRPESLALPASHRQLREILRDIRKRLPRGGAVVGVVMQPGEKVNGQEAITEEESPACAQSAVSTLLSLLRSVFPLNNRDGPCCEVRAAALTPGHEESRRDVQRAACEALTAAAAEHLDEGTALTILSYPNGDCAETTADA
ncbi:uncharacterized protein C2orf72 homolog [Dendropsophus ebraccatus]|uniref:uncharacterized protein C2orf72 homolog n=1 Tax=Dendropsophus ebraccatus TaxID=150705 RepID=UPI00383146C4